MTLERWITWICNITALWLRHPSAPERVRRFRHLCNLLPNIFDLVTTPPPPPVPAPAPVAVPLAPAAAPTQVTGPPVSPPAQTSQDIPPHWAFEKLLDDEYPDEGEELDSADLLACDD